MSNEEKKFTKLDVVSGKSYFICQCGQSAKYPLCDGSHKNTSFSPEKYVASADTSVSVCGCSDLKTVVCDCA
jgi:CDGSH-type Zn-finger protein